MHIQINTDKNIEGGEALAEHVRSVVEKTLKHHADGRPRGSTPPRYERREDPERRTTHVPWRPGPRAWNPWPLHKAANNHAAVEGAATSLANLLRTRW
ncbi:MAG: hypothetical protein IPL64_08470 [Flavobacteriales bacterium]|nr:hypothetical protein [Flavobacteriales bacterium]